MVLFAVAMLWSLWFAIGAAVCAALTALGIRDMIQTHHSLKRNYPILAKVEIVERNSRL